MFEQNEMIDVASHPDVRGIAIEQVGVTGVWLPVLIRRKGGGVDTVVARISLAADLHHASRGTHMSRFMTALDQWREHPISYAELATILADVRTRLNAEVAHLELAFKYFMAKKAPVSGQESLMDYDVSFRGRLDAEQFRFILTVDVPVTALCPCSKEIACYGAHNQRAVIHCEMTNTPGRILWIEDLVQMLEAQGSAPLYPILKREDEKFVTEQAYDHPKFVEDILRDTVTALRADPRVATFRVRVDSMESIHNHNVYAAYTEGLPGW